MVPARARLAIARSDSAEKKQDATACNTSGLIHVASTNRITISSQKLLIVCFGGIVMRLNAMSIYQTFRDLLARIISPISCSGNRYFGRADSSLGAGLFKSLLLRYQSNSFLKTVRNWVTRYPWSNISAR
jgi:hypothetical protein